MTRLTDEIGLGAKSRQSLPLALMLAAVLFLVGGLFVGGGQAMAQSAPPVAYKLSPGDEISVKMPLNPELDTSGPIGPDGRFSIPLAGVFPLAGLTIEEAQARIAENLRMQQIVADARPSITVARYGGVVYVGGEVRNPGAIALNRPLNPLQAIISAGGFLNSARSRRIAVLRAVPGGEGRYDINVRQYIRSGDAKGQVDLAPGDIVFVPRSAIAEVGLWIDQHINALIPDALHFNVNFGDNGNNATATIP